MKEVRTLFSDYVFALAGRGFSTIFNFVVIVILERRLGSVEYGRFGLMLLAANVAFQICLTWMNSGFQTLGKAEFYRTGKISRTFAARSAITAMILSALAVVYLVGASWIARSIQSDLPAVYLVIVYLTVLSLEDFAFYICQTVNRIKLFSVLQFVEKAAVLLVVGALIVFRIGVDVYDAVLIYVCGALLACVVAVAALDKSLLRPLRCSRGDIAELARVCYPMIFTAASGFVVAWIEVLVIKHVFSLKEVGTYFFVSQLVNGINQFTIVLGTILTPVCIALLVQGRTDILRRYVEGIIPLFSFAWASLMIVCNVAACAYFSWRYGRESSIYSRTFVLLALSSTAVFLAATINPIAVAAKIFKEYAAINVIAGLVNVAGAIMLIPEFGVIGGAYTKIITLTISQALYIRATRKIVPMEQARFFIYMAPQAVFCAAFIIYGSSIAAAISGALALIVIAAWQKPFRKNELRLLDAIDIPEAVRAKIYAFFGVLTDSSRPVPS